jgi:ribosomal protein S17E
MGKIRSREKRRKARQILDIQGKEKYQGKGFEEIKQILNDMHLFESKTDRNHVASEIIRLCQERIK